MRKLATLLLAAATLISPAAAQAVPVAFPAGAHAHGARHGKHARKHCPKRGCRKAKNARRTLRVKRTRAALRAPSSVAGIQLPAAQVSSSTQPAATAQSAAPPAAGAGPAAASPSASSSSSQASSSLTATQAAQVPPPNNPDSFVKGVNTNLQGWGAPNVPQIAGEIHNLGAKWAREDLPWSTTEPSPGVFNWTAFDAIVYTAKAQGITVLPIVGYAPSWTTPEDSAAYATFVAAAVKRYGPGTQANLPWFELWNEPNLPYAWSGKTAEPAAYAKDVRAAAEAAKAAVPSVKLLMMGDYEDSSQVGGSTPWQVSMIDDYFTAVPDLGNWIDGIAVHPYSDNDPSLPLDNPAGVTDNSAGWKDTSGNWGFQRIDSIRAKFLAHGVNLPFWVTEMGWTTHTVSESTQATYWSKAFPLVKARPWVRALFPFALREWTATPTDDQPQYGLERFGSWAPKPAFTAVQQGLATLS